MGRPKQNSFLKSCDLGKIFTGERRLEIPYDLGDESWANKISLVPELDPAVFSSAEHFIFASLSDDFAACLRLSPEKADLRRVTSGCLVPIQRSTKSRISDIVPAIHVRVSGSWTPADGNTHETFIAGDVLITYGFLANPVTRPGSVCRPIYETAWLRKIGARLNRLLPPSRPLARKSEVKDGNLIITQQVPCYGTDGPLEYLAQEHLLPSETQYLLLHVMWNSWEQRRVKVEVRREELVRTNFSQCEKGAFSTMCKRAGLPSGKQRPRIEMIST